jgi:hypothetical protein
MGFLVKTLTVLEVASAVVILTIVAFKLRKWLRDRSR